MCTQHIIERLLVFRNTCANASSQIHPSKQSLETPWYHFAKGWVIVGVFYFELLLKMIFVNVNCYLYTYIWCIVWRNYMCPLWTTVESTLALDIVKMYWLRYVCTFYWFIICWFHAGTQDMCSSYFYNLLISCRNAEGYV